MREGSVFLFFPISTRYNTLSFFVHICMMHAYIYAASASLSWSMKLLAFATRQSAPTKNSGPLSAIHIIFWLFPCERA